MWLLAFITHALEGGKDDLSDIAVAFFALCFVSLASSLVSIMLLSRIAQENLFNLRLWLASRILAAPLREAQMLGEHRMMAALTSDVDSVVNAQEILPALLIEGSKVVAVFAYLWTLSPGLFAFVSAFIASSFLAVRAPQSWGWRWLERARSSENTIFRHFRAVTDGGKELRMNARRRRAFLEQDLRAAAGVLKTQRLRAQAIFIFVERAAEALLYLLIGVILFLVPRFYGLSLEASTGFAVAMLYLGGPLSFIGGWLPKLGRGAAALRNIEAMGLRLTKDTHDADDESRALSQLRPGALELVGVTYRYDNESGDGGCLIGPISLRIPPGEILFLTGGNGSGKTTLALLMLGLLVPEAGELRLGGQKVCDENREAYRQNFSAVFADAYVFDPLLGYGEPPAQARAEKMLTLLELDGKLRIEEGRFSTTALSRGERKRLALLTAYVEDRPLYLFDEWAAEQDPQFRDAFYRRLLPDLKACGKTVVVITHDDRYFHLADHLIRMSAGQIDGPLPGALEIQPSFGQRCEHA
ncbi:ABC transporter ATP-binding protein [Methylosinus sp. C49]|nr:ABC transporter ATP-binding protein [Methylosinus sp. C49]